MFATEASDGKIRSVEVFRSNVRKAEVAAGLADELQSRFPGSRVNFDLSDCDKILRVEGENLSPEKIIELVRSFGYEASLL